MARMKRLIASVLCLAMLLSVVPFGAFAAETEETTAQTEPVEVITEPAESVPATETPTENPTEAPTETPTEVPTEVPTETPTEAPTETPTEAPVEEPILPEQIDIPEPQEDASVQGEGDVVKVEHNGETTYYADLQTAFDGFAPSNNTYGGTYVVTLLGNTTGVSKNLQYPTEVLNITLDLNGYTITGPSGTSTTVVNINFGSTNSTDCVFTLKDSSGTNAGTITGGKNGVIFAGKASTFNFEGGTITGNHGATTGGGIKLGGNHYFNMTGGVITGNSVTGTSSANTGLGGGIYGVYMNITGGAIYGNTAIGGSGKYTGRGGGICTDITGTAGYHYVNIGAGVSIYGNTADNAGDDLMIQKNSTNASKLTFALAGDNWYIDGMDGQNQTSTLTDRYSAEDPVAYTEGGWAEGTKKAVGLKYVESAPSVPEYTVTYTDGVEDAEIFADQVYTVKEGEATPAFEGTPARDGYTFTGWEPAVAETVTADATYVAQWKEAARGAINGVGYREDNEGITLELENVLAYESVSVNVYSGESLLTTLSLNNNEFLGTVQDYLTVSIRTSGESTSWAATPWEPTDDVVPTKYELYIDDVLMDTHEETVDAALWNALNGTKAIFTVTYTDGVEDAETFADQVYTVTEGEATPAFEGTPAREGYTFTGWEPAVAETVTADATYVAQWKEIPAAPDKYGENVTPALVRVICDADEDHAPIDIKWQSQSTKVRDWVSGVVWSEDENTWIVPIRIDSISVYYVWLNFEKAYNDILHPLVPDAPLPEDENYIDTYLKWDEAQQLWVTMDGQPIEVHTACKTVPDAPTVLPSSFQIQVKGDLDHDGIYGEKKADCALGVSELRAVTIPEGAYTLSEVYGSREEGFFVDVTVNLADGDVFNNTWIEYCAPGGDYRYNWDMTEKTVTFTLKYDRSLTGTLYGSNRSDWAATFTGYKVGEAYVDEYIPAPEQNTVTDKLVAIICDSDGERHETVYGKWYPLGHCETRSDITWNAELGAYTVDVKIGSLYIMYVNQLEDANYGTRHDLVEDITQVLATLKWDAEQQLWVTLDGNPIELHTTCRTAPVAPAYQHQLDSYQVKVWGELNGELKAYTTSMPENGYTIGEVYGSREEGFFVDVTVTLEDGDAFITNWIEKKNPGETYVYDWDKTERTITFTLKYTGDLNGTLYGNRYASNTNVDWVLPATGKDYGVIAEAYTKHQVLVTYTDGVENKELFADQTYSVFVGEQTPAFQGTPDYYGYSFLGWTPEVSEIVTGHVTYVAQWVEQEPVLIYAITNGDKSTVEVLEVGFADNGVNLLDWLNANVTIPERAYYTVEKWYDWKNFGTEIAADRVVDVKNVVYVNYVGGQYTVTLNGNGADVDPESVTVGYNTAVGELPVPTRTLYTFQGWYDENGNQVTAETVYTWMKDITLTAKWVQNAPAKPYKIVNVVSGVHVYWNAVEGADKYGVWRSETGAAGSYKWLGNPTVPHFTDVTAESGKTYHYAVTTYDAQAKTHSTKSPAIGIIYVATPDITLRVNREVGIGLRWDKIEGATGYAIYRKSFDGEDAWVRVATIEGNETFSWNDTSVKDKNGEIYRYTIRALAGNDMKTLSGCRNTGRTMVRLTTRQLLGAVKTGDTAIKCTWATSSVVDGYEVRFMVDGEVYETFTVGNYKTGVKTFTGLETGHTYKIQVRGYKNVAGVGGFYSAWSTAIEVEL